MANTQTKRSILVRLRNYFLAGIVVLVPIGFTLYLTIFLIKISSKLLPNEINPNNYLPFSIPGLEILLSVIITDRFGTKIGCQKVIHMDYSRLFGQNPCQSLLLENRPFWAHTVNGRPLAFGTDWHIFFWHQLATFGTRWHILFPCDMGFRHVIYLV